MVSCSGAFALYWNLCLVLPESHTRLICRFIVDF
jgi:hypothetical protein